MNRLRALLSVSMFVLAYFVIVAPAQACPFCSAVSQTFSEEMSTMDCVAIAYLDKVAKISNLNTDDARAEVPKSRFKIAKVIKGHEFVKADETFETIYFGEAKKDRPFLVMATDAPNLMWSSPLILSERAKNYLLQVSELPRMAEGTEDVIQTGDARRQTDLDGSNVLQQASLAAAKAAREQADTALQVKRLNFFQQYLEDEDEMLARDAYDEFAKAPYKDVIALKEHMDHDQLIKFIKNPDVPSNRRRLYFTMLGVCGTQADADLLGTLMASEERRDKAGLDAMLACYMILKAEAGLDRVDELFLKNKDAEYADTYAAIMAIRFHGSETDVIPRTRLVKSLRHMLDRPELADLVIPDLARWEDWEVMPRLVDLFTGADENSSWVRVPVINYLRACPLPSAQAHIDQLKEVDPDAVKRAMTFFPLTPEKPAGEEEPASDGSKEKIEASTEQPKVNAVSNGAAPIQAADLAMSPSGSPVVSPAAASESVHAVTNAMAATEVRHPAGEVTLSVASEGAADVAEAVQPEPEVKSVDATAAKTTSISTDMRAGNRESLVSLADSPETLQQVEALANSGANIWMLLGVTFLGGGLCFVTMRSILGVGTA